MRHWLFLPILLLFASTIEAQPLGGLLTLRRGSGEIGVDFRVIGDSRRGYGGRDERLRQWIRIPFMGTLGRTDLLAYSLVLRPSFFRSRSTGHPDDLRGRQTQVDFSARCPSCGPFAASVAWSRGAGTAGRALLTLNEHTSTSKSLDLRLPSDIIPLRLSLSSRSLQQTWQPSPEIPVISQEYVNRTARFSAETSKSKLLLYKHVLERLDNTQVLPSFFTSEAADFFHTARWGKGSALRTALQYQRRSRDGTSYSHFHWSERLALKHTQRLRSVYGFASTTTRNGTARSDNRLIDGELTYRAARWSTLKLRAASRRTIYLGRESSVKSVSGGFSASSPWRGEPRISVGGGLGYDARGWDTDISRQVPVINERHSIPDIRAVTLGEAGIVPETIEVTDRDENLVFVEAVDYEVDIVGGRVLLRFPITSRIEVGDTILVSYRFEVGRGRQEGVVNGSYNAAVEARGLKIRHSFSMRSPRSRRENAHLVTSDIEEESTRIRLLQSVSGTEIRIDAERRRSRSLTFDLVSKSVGAKLRFPATPKWRQSLTMGWRISGEGDDAVRVLVGSTTAVWLPRRSLRVHGGIEANQTVRFGQFPETSITGRVEVGHVYALLETTLLYAAQRRMGTVSGTIHRLSLHTRRRF